MLAASLRLSPPAPPAHRAAFPPTSSRGQTPSLLFFTAQRPTPPARCSSSRSSGPVTRSREEDDDGDEEYYDNDSEELELEEGELEEEADGTELEAPRGFGVGKTYDTSVEEQLLKGLLGSGGGEQRRPKSPPRLPLTPDSSRPNGTGDGVCIRISNLPKKKNIHRDLREAFRAFPGLISVNPAVTANKKTRDPICKGFAFVEMNTLDAATRFVQTFSTRSISFGKVEKRIKCVIVEPHHPSDLTKDSPRDGTCLTSERSKREVTDDREESIACDGMESIARHGEVVHELLDKEHDDVSDFEIAQTSAEEQLVVLAEDSPLVASAADAAHASKWDFNDGVTLAPARRKNTARKKKKMSNLRQPGSSSRLKLKERSVLDDVFAKYKDANLVTSLGDDK